MKQVIVAAAMLALGGVAGWSIARGTSTAAAPVQAGAVQASETTPGAADGAAGATPRYMLTAHEGCTPLDGGEPFSAPATRTLRRGDGTEVSVALVPVTRANGTGVVDTLVSANGAQARSQIGVHSSLLTDGLLLRVAELDGVRREVTGDAPHLHGPHPMAR